MEAANSFLDIFSTTPLEVLNLLVKATIIYVTIIFFTRLSGLRSFSKMTTYDFAITVVIGSIIASTIILPNITIVQGILAVAVLFFLQFVLSVLQMHSHYFSWLATNEPILLMRDGEVLDDNLRQARVSKPELYAELRQNGVRQLEEVKAVIFETTAEVSVLTQFENEGEIDDELIKWVRGEMKHGQKDESHGDDESTE